MFFFFGEGGLGKEGPDRISHGGAEAAQDKEMAWTSSYSTWGSKPYQGPLDTSLLSSPGTTGEHLGWGMAGGRGQWGIRAICGAEPQ